MAISVEIDEKQFEAVKDKLKKLSPAQQEKVMVRALKRAGTTAKTEASKALRNRYTVKAAAIKEDMTLKFQKTSAALEIKGYHRDLSDFKITPPFTPPTPGESTTGKASPKVTVLKGQGGAIRDSFWTQVGGHKGVFRQGSKTKEAVFRFPSGSGTTNPDRKKMLPIGEQIGPATAQMANTVETDTDISGKVLDTLNKRIDHEINRILGVGE